MTANNLFVWMGWLRPLLFDECSAKSILIATTLRWLMGTGGPPDMFSAVFCVRKFGKSVRSHGCQACQAAISQMLRRSQILPRYNRKKRVPRFPKFPIFVQEPEVTTREERPEAQLEIQLSMVCMVCLRTVGGRCSFAMPSKVQSCRGDCLVLVEGNIMVFSYRHACIRRRTSRWTLDGREHRRYLCKFIFFGRQIFQP